jgi:hypothetical protein
MDRYEVSAYNTSTKSNNLIHDDSVARQFGFRGGLVAGVDVYAYLAHLPVARWDRDWLTHGTLRARFHEPIYDGEAATTTMDHDGTLELRNPSGALCAGGIATIERETPIDVACGGALPHPIPAATPELLAVDTVFAPLRLGFHAEFAPPYLNDVRETHPAYSELRCAHPGWLLRQANNVLVANVRLGPWIHVESWVRNHAIVADDARLEVRAVVRNEWERKGHRFVTLDVAVLADDQPAASIEHTAIWRTRAPDPR